MPSPRDYTIHIQSLYEKSLTNLNAASLPPKRIDSVQMENKKNTKNKNSAIKEDSKPYVGGGDNVCCSAFRLHIK